jgi:hypothetical protein
VDTQGTALRSGFARLPYWLAIAVGIAVAAFVLLVAYQLWQFLSNFNRTAELLSQTYGINQYLSKAAALFFVGPLAWLAKKAFLTKHKTEGRKLATRVATGLYACAYLVGIWFVQQSVYFDHETGVALKYWSMDPAGRIVLYDSPGFDTRTQQPLQPANADIVRAYEQQKAGEVPRLVSVDDFVANGAFDRNTGAPRVWVARRADGSFALYDRPGFDSATRSVLQGATPELVSEIEQWLARVTESKRRQAEETARAEAERAKQVERQQAAAEKTAFVDRYLDRRTRKIAGTNNVAVRVLPAASVDVSPIVTAISRALRTRGFSVLPVFNDRISADGLDSQLFEGSPSLVERLDMASFTDSAVLGRIRLGAANSVNGLFVTETSLDLRQISARTGEVMDQIEVRAKGGGLTSEASLGKSINELAQNIGTELVTWPRL